MKGLTLLRLQLQVCLSIYFLLGTPGVEGLNAFSILQHLLQILKSDETDMRA